MDEHHRQTGAPDSERESSVPASAALPPQVETPAPADTPAVKKVGFRDIYGDLLGPANLWLFGIAALLGLIGLLGGWDKVAAKETTLPTLTADKEFQAEPFKLEFKKAFWYEQIQGLPPVSTGNRALMVTLDATNTSPRPVLVEDVKRAFRLTTGGLVMNFQPAPPERAAPDVYRGSDLLRLRTLPPGLKTRLALVWEQDSKQPTPQELTVVVIKQTYRKSFSDGSMRYFDPTESATVNLPLTEFKLP